MPNSKRIRTLLAAGGGVLGLVLLSACASGAAEGGDEPQEVTFAVPSWVGAEANVAVAAHLLEQELNVEATSTPMDEPDAWDALHSGEVDAVLEDWRGDSDKEKQYIDQEKTVVEGGDLGVTGHIGWFVPKYYAEEHPEVTDWRNLNELVADFRTPASGNQGQLLEGSPSYTTHDDAIIENLALDLKTVYSGSEAAQIAEIRESYQQRKPFLTYWWTPHWLNEEVELVEVELPEYREGCAADPEHVDCAYPHTPVQKYFNAEFAEEGGPAAEFLKNFRWDERHQSEVARLIKVDELSPAQAARTWAAANRDVWQEWLPAD